MVRATIDTRFHNAAALRSDFADHPLIREYQRSLAALRGQGVKNELGLRRPFENLLAGSARLRGWRFEVMVVPIRQIRGQRVVLDRIGGEPG
ncbi:MAG TPA: hypothetical protein VKG86_03040 [Terracidiphilus sp.]|nr:hypothetical protein [Terracidiphilus sp.]